MTVWLATYSVDYEDTDVIGVASTRAGAVRACLAHLRRSWSEDDVAALEWEDDLARVFDNYAYAVSEWEVSQAIPA